MRKIAILVLIPILCICFNGCYDSKEISRIAFVISVGFDESSYTFQIVKPSVSEGEVSEDSPLLTKTIYAPNVYDAMTKLNSEVSEICDYSHIKIAVFSRKVLEKGIEKEIDAMLKSNEFHPNTKIAMCEGKVSEYMKEMKIPLNANPAEYYENIFKSEYTQYSPDTRLKDMQKNYSTHIAGCVLPIINTKNGMAITSDFKLTGTADSEQVLIYNMLTNPDFEGDFTIADGIVVKFKKTYCKFNQDISQNPPKTVLILYLEGNVVWSEENTNIDSVARLAKKKITNDTKSFLTKCSKNYKADIFDFYKLAKTNYPTIGSWEKEDWQSLYENTEYTVNAHITIKREGLIKE